MNRRSSFVLASLIAVAPFAFGANYGFMKDTPVSKFNDADFKLYEGAIRNALSTQDLGKPVEWSNEKTGSGGTVTPQAGDKPECRKLSITTHHKTMKAESERNVCKVNGQWKAVG